MKSPPLDLPPLPYERAPDGAPDRYRLTRDTAFRWRGPPARVVGAFAVGETFACTDGWLRAGRDPDGAPVLALTVRRGFHFSVTAAPDFPRALAAACAHDWLYAHARDASGFFGMSRRRFLHAADHWFLAQMRASGFLLRRTYFVAARVFGYWFNTLAGLRGDA
jgi:hypothetical protein